MTVSVVSVIITTDQMHTIVAINSRVKKDLPI